MSDDLPGPSLGELRAASANVMAAHLAAGMVPDALKAAVERDDYSAAPIPSASTGRPPNASSRRSLRTGWRRASRTTVRTCTAWRWTASTPRSRR